MWMCAEGHGIECCVVSLDKVVDCRVYMLLGIRRVRWLVRVVLRE
jgi:hypothetical protein